MNDDDFTTAARAEAERLTPEGTSVPVLRTERDNLVHMAEWARTYLAEQEPTDAEVEATAQSIHEHFPRKYLDEFGFTCTARWTDLEPYMREEYRAVARAALTAARAVRRDA